MMSGFLQHLIQMIGSDSDIGCFLKWDGVQLILMLKTFVGGSMREPGAFQAVSTEPAGAFFLPVYFPHMFWTPWQVGCHLQFFASQGSCSYLCPLSLGNVEGV